MDVQKEFGHFGEINLAVSGSAGTQDIPLVILRKAPLKYYDPKRDKDDKDKADVAFAFFADDWHLIGWTDHNPETPDLDRFEDMLCDKLNEI